MSNLPELMERLEKAAQAATEGPWFDVTYGTMIRTSDDGTKGDTVCLFTGRETTYKNSKANSRYVAEANPAVILELITALRASTLREGELRELVREYRSSAFNHSCCINGRCHICIKADALLAPTVAPVPEVTK